MKYKHLLTNIQQLISITESYKEIANAVWQGAKHSVNPLNTIKDVHHLIVNPHELHSQELRHLGKNNLTDTAKGEVAAYRAGEVGVAVGEEKLTDKGLDTLSEKRPVEGKIVKTAFDVMKDLS